MQSFYPLFTFIKKNKKKQKKQKKKKEQNKMLENTPMKGCRLKIFHNFPFSRELSVFWNFALITSSEIFVEMVP